MGGGVGDSLPSLKLDVLDHSLRQRIGISDLQQVGILGSPGAGILPQGHPMCC